MQRTQILPLVALLAALTATVAAYGVYRSTPPSFHGTDLGPGIPAQDFTLAAADRGDVSLSDFQGRAVLMFFGYTHCPDVCPLTLDRLRRALEMVGEPRRDVQVLLVTVDPEMDTPHRLREYLQNFDLSFVGLSGTRSQLEAVTQAYGVYAGEAPPVEDDEHAAHAGHGDHRPPPRLIDHTSQVFGIDRKGNFRLLWGGDATAEQIAEDVRALLRL
jgi:protein SCO1